MNIVYNPIQKILDKMENIVSRIDNNYKILKLKGTRNDFASLLQNNPGILIFKFTADWCGPCKKSKSIPTRSPMICLNI